MELKPRDAAEVPADLNQTDLPARTAEAKTGSGVGGARASSTKTEGRRVSGGGVTLINPGVSGGKKDGTE